MFNLSFIAMSDRLTKLLIGTLCMMGLGFFLFPYISPSRVLQPVAEAKQKPKTAKKPQIKVDDWQREEEITEADDDAWTTEETTETPEEAEEARRRALAAQDDESYEEEDVPEDPNQKSIPPARSKNNFSTALSHARRLAKTMEKMEKTRFVKEDYPAEKWAEPHALYQALAEDVLNRMGKLEDGDVMEFLSKPENCLDLARITLIRKAGTEHLQELAAKKNGAAMLARLTSDLNWMQGLLYSGSTKDLAAGMENMLKLYPMVTAEDLDKPVVQKMLATTATEFAREGWNEKDMKARFKYYYNSYKEELLNDVFEELDYWDMRFVTGSKEGDSVNPSWGGPKNLAWMRDNVRLPADRYLGAEGQLVYRLRNVAGDTVFSAAYLAPIWEYTDHTTAWAHREIGGVCGALSHYATYGALASGIPALTMGEPGHCSYAIRVGKEWKCGNGIYWQKSIHKNLWDGNDRSWDYLVLMQDLYGDRYMTLVSDQMVAMADFLGARKKMTAALSTYEVAINVQPLNLPGLKRYAGYLRLKAPKETEKWIALHDNVTDGLGATHYDAAASFLARRVYPDMVPLVKERSKLNKMFGGLFKNFKGWGTNRWDVTEVLDAQMSSFKNPDDQRAYLKECLRVLMGQKEYSGAVLTWGLGYLSKLPKGNDALQTEFTDLLLDAMRRTSSAKKEQDATWATLGEAAYAAAKGHERRTFQAIGKLAYTKCRAKFPKRGVKFRGFSGKVVSTTGLINTATTIGNASDCALHWAVLQRFGGRMPGKFEGSAGVTVELESKCDINGVVCVSSEKTLRSDREWYLETSPDGLNWERCAAKGMVEGSSVRFDTKAEKLRSQHIRLLREGDKYEPGIVGFYVFGKNLKR